MNRNRFIKAAGCVLLTLSMAGCQEKPEPKKPELDQIREIAELCTLETYYHNVAKSVKEPGKSFWDIGKVERKYWVVYTGKVKLGVDFNNVKMKADGNKLTITIPTSTVQEVGFLKESLTPESVYKSDDSFWNKNKITDEDQKNTVNNEQKNMEVQAYQNKSLLRLAQNRAKDLIQAYVETIGEAAGVEYDITWKLEEIVVPENIQKIIDEQNSKDKK